MGKYIGGPIDGNDVQAEVIERDSRYSIHFEGENNDPKAAYMRVRGSDDFKLVQLFDSFEQYEEWCITNIVE